MAWIWQKFDQIDRIENNIARILFQLQAIRNERNKGEIKMSAELDALRAQVAQNATVEASAVALIQGLAKQLQDAIANDDKAALHDLASSLQVSATDLAKAITDNTPQANTANTAV